MTWEITSDTIITKIELTVIISLLDFVIAVGISLKYVIFSHEFLFE